VGLVSQEWFTSTQILTALGTSSSTIRELVGASPEGPAPRTLGPHIPFDPSLKQVMKRAVKEAERLDSKMVSCGHLLLALLQEGSGQGAVVLKAVGVSYLSAVDALRDLSSKD
jgi:ATP-dependent Clp protease ATP-binding subunit ClpA